MLKKVKFLVFLIGIALLAPRLIQAAVADDIRADSQQIAKWMSEEISDLMAFHTASIPLIPGDVIGVFGFEVGVAGALSTSDLDIQGFKNLNFVSLDNKGSVINLPDDVGVPSVVFHAKAGLPGGFDAGFKYGTMSFDENSADAKSEFSNSVYGVEVRKRLLGGGLTGIAIPDLAVSLAYDVATGDLTRTEVYNSGITGGNLNAQTQWKSEWDVGAITARGLLSKKVLIVTPYVGLGYTTFTGSTDSTISTLGTAAPGGVINEVVKASGDADDSVFHVMAGAELSVFPLVRLSLGYLWADENWSANIGVRTQFR